MQWENLTSQEFASAVQKTGVCVISMSVIEKHCDHLPLGTDMFNGHAIACIAAEKEPAVVFPPFYFGQIYEAKCFPGTITIRPGILVELIRDIMDEIGRNGFKKIIVYCAHGGNSYLLPFILQTMLDTEKPYSVYYYNGVLYTGLLSEDRQKEWKELCETSIHGHACECETSLTLASVPKLVKMERVPDKPADPLHRVKDMPNSFTALSWYGDFPDHYSGDARYATIEKGHRFQQLLADSFAEYIAVVKKDEGLPTLNREFFNRVGLVGEVI